MMVFVPFTPTSAVALRGGETRSADRAFTATPSLRRTLGRASDDEEADFAALSIAGAAALGEMTGVRRLVLAAEVADNQVVDRRTELGEVEVRELRWGQVQALFSDEESAGPAVARAAAAAAGVPLAAALELPAVTELSEGYDLLWYAPEELDGLR